MAPLISIVVPVYNASETINRCFVSVKNQSYRQWELLFIDDHSTDKSFELLVSIQKSYPELKIHILKNNSKGVSSARNLGMKQAKGEYIAFLDADDYWHEDKLLIVSREIDNNTLLYASAFAFELHPVKESFTVSRISFLKCLVNNQFVTPSVVIKNGSGFLFNESLQYSEDYELWLRMLYDKPAKYIHLPLVVLNRPVRSAGGLSANKWAMRKGEITAYYHLKGLAPMFMLLFPLLTGYSIGKHIFKMLS